MAFRDRCEARFAKATAEFDRSAEWAFDGPPPQCTGWSRSPVSASTTPDGYSPWGRRVAISCHLGGVGRWDVVGRPGPPHRQPCLRADRRPVRRARSRTRPDVGGVTGAPRWLGDARCKATPSFFGVGTKRRTPHRSLHLSRVGRRWRLDADFDTEGGALIDTAIRHAMTRDADGEPPAPWPAATPTPSSISPLT